MNFYLENRKLNFILIFLNNKKKFNFIIINFYFSHYIKFLFIYMFKIFNYMTIFILLLFFILI